MKTITTVVGIRDSVRDWRNGGATVGLVPTMGSLHAGHLGLVERARQENELVVVSIFVNPLQFGPHEDFDRYPRQLGADRDLIEGVAPEAVIYAPEVGEMFPPGSTTRVTVGPLENLFEGASRPGHFEGVATVVCKLLGAVQPDRAYFGRKDAQQVAVIERMVTDLDLGAEIVACPISRDVDGLALSSRNAYLGTEQRRAAPCLHRALGAANAAYLGGAEATELRELMLAVLRAEPMARVDYVELVDPTSFHPPGKLALIALQLGDVRLIDNHLLGQPFPADGNSA